MAAVVVEQHIEVLARTELQRLDRRQPQVDPRDIGREQCLARDPARQPLDLDLRRAGDQPRLDDEVGTRKRLAEQHASAHGVLGGQTGRPAARVMNLAGQQPRAAGTAVPGLAAVRDVESNRERRIEHVLLGADVDLAAMRLEADLEHAARRRTPCVKIGQCSTILTPQPSLGCCGARA